MLLTCDARRYGKAWKSAKGFWTTAGYRVRRARKSAGMGLKLLLLPVDICLAILRFQLTDAEIPSSARIGPGLYLPHPQGVIVAQQIRIGSQVSIFQQVTLGNWNGGWPRIHARTAIFAGAKVIGQVTIGRSCYVGANAVVSKDVPAWHAATGIPASNRIRKEAPAGVQSEG